LRRAKALGRDRAKNLRRKTMKKGCLGRFVVFLLVVGCAGLGYKDYSLYQDKSELQNRLTAADARLDQLTADMKSHHVGPATPAAAPAHPAANDDWLREAQRHANNAAQALKNRDFLTVGRESTAALQELRKAPDKMTAEAQSQYDSVKGQLLGIQKQVQSVKNEAESALHDLTGG